MLITQMTSEECREILAKTGFGHLGSSHKNESYVVPMHFAYEPDYLYGFSNFGRKIEWMRANPIVCVEVDEVTGHSSWASVIINGRYQEFPNTSQRSSERLHAFGLLEKRPLWWQTAQAAKELRTTQPFPPIFYRIHIDAMTGHRAARDDDPAEYSKGFHR